MGSSRGAIPGISDVIDAMYDINTLAKIITCLNEYMGDRADMVVCLAAKIETQSKAVMAFLDSIEFRSE